MLTRLKISGFKNLVDVDVQFGPFTCIAGANAVGKSNLFDAIRFLSLLANDTLVNAALAVRAEGERSGDLRSIFHRVGDRYADKMNFEAEMLIAEEAIDDLGVKATAKIRHVRYQLELGYRSDTNLATLGSFVLLKEQLEHITKGESPSLLRFPHKKKWRDSALSVPSGRRTSPFITTEDNGKTIRLRQDGVQGMPKSFLAANLPRTVLSTVNATESPTALVVKREMQAWQTLQLEPSALRKPDRFITPPGMLADGSHLPATLYHLAHRSANNGDSESNGLLTYDQIAYRLSQLIEGVMAVGIERNPVLELLTLQITEQNGTIYPARALSDGTLRFLALAVLDLNPDARGVICMEEPENGIHPSRIPAMIDLLQSIAFDPDEPISDDNPLRQVIINTHSPVVVAQVPDDSLLVAELKERIDDSNHRFKTARFSWLPDTWRARAQPEVSPVARGQVLAYLNPVLSEMLLRQASGLQGRRLQHFQVAQAVRRISDLLTDFSPLRQLSAFQTLEDDIRTAAARTGWAESSRKTLLP